MAEFELKYVTQTNYNSGMGLYNNVVKPRENGIPVGPWAIEPGTVDFINPDDYSCYVTTESGKTLPHVLYTSPWFSYQTGSGFYMYPQVRTKVLVGRDLYNRYYIIGFLPANKQGEEVPYLNNRFTDIQEGDMCLTTEHGSYIRLGNFSRTIHLICDSVCKIQMQSSEHRIFMRCHRLYINTAAGLMQMDTTDDGKTTTVAYFRMKLGDTENFVKVIMGSTGVAIGDKLKLNTDGSRTSTEVIFALNICNKASITIDTEGNVVTYCKSIQNRVVEDVDNIVNGKISTAVQKGVNTANKGDLTIEATGGLNINAGGDLSLSGKTGFTAVGQKVTLGSNGEMNITSKGPMTRSASGVIIDRGTGIQHSAGIAGTIPALKDVSVGETEIAGIMDTTISDMEKYNPATVANIPDPTNNISSSSSGSPTYTPGENPLTEQTSPPSDEEIRIVAEATKEYYKKTSSGAGIGREGNLTLYDDNGSALGTYYFINGPWGNGAIDYGKYNVTGGQRTEQSGMWVEDPTTGAVSGWKFNIDNVEGRTGIRIHPDGNVAGTNGCIGIVGTYETLEDFYSKLKGLLASNNGKVGLEYKEKTV